MKLLSIIIYKWNAEKCVELSEHIDLSSFSVFQRSTIKEHLKFHNRLIAARTSMGRRQTIQFQDNLGFCHAYTHPSGLCCTVLSDPEYPMRVAFTLIAELLKKFQEKHAGRWETLTSDVQLEFPEGDEFLKRFQNPAEADKLTKIQKDLDEVKDIVLKSIDDLLERGETLDSLMQKSEDLSHTSLQFYRTAKKNNQCCKWY
eukprot:GDKH01025898.1.p1 GENE.GDKH01025898.1~~GDKH01025898.1.p1  ORF type:complete len:201 (+),score=21.95 GDKH01025898.1:138-740(+)